MFVHEFALLVAIATPVAVLCAIHAGLWAAGERDTLILPGMRGYPAIALEAAAVEMPAPMQQRPFDGCLISRRRPSGKLWPPPRWRRPPW